MSRVDRFTPAAAPSQASDDLQREALVELEARVSALAPLAPGSPVVDPRLFGNRVLLGHGEYLGMKLSRDDTVVMGVSPAAVVTRPSEISGFRSVSGVRFELSSEAPHLVRFLGTDGVGQFVNCIFVRAPSATSQMFMVTTGWRLSFLGCVFLGGDGSLPVFLHGGAAADIEVIGGMDLTGGGLGTVTASHVL